MHCLDLKLDAFKNEYLIDIISRRAQKFYFFYHVLQEKPYSYSKSHKLIREQTLKNTNPWVVHELIITSPLGLVPRDLELIYPANLYDIPVTGHWYEDEKEIIRTMLKSYLEKNKYEKILVHLSPGIQGFILDLLKDTEITCKDHPTSDKSLNNLYETLEKTTNEYKKVEASSRFREDMQSRASYQFGRTTSEKLLKDCIIRGRLP